MKRVTRALGVVGILAIVAPLGVAIPAAGKDAVHVDSAKASYAELVPGASRATLWGDPGSGAHAAFTKFTPGFSNALHTHTNDLRIVVVKGAYVFKPEGGREIRVDAGQYLFIPGGTRHATGSDAQAGALFYQESDGKFDLNPVG
jgi:quercetin dioxygenase-like cupin family protein